jgi:peptidyl-dipeptidase A
MLRNQRRNCKQNALPGLQGAPAEDKIALELLLKFIILFFMNLLPPREAHHILLASGVTMKPIYLIWITAFMFLSCGVHKNEKELRKFLTDRVGQIEPLAKEANLAYWRASTTGQPQAFEEYSRLNLKLKKLYSDADDFAFLSKLKNEGGIRDPLLSRQLTLLYNTYLENQMPPELLQQITEQSSRIEQKFSTFRGTIGSKRVTGNEINDILRKETRSKKREEAWLASKMVAPVVAADVVALAQLRNQAAVKLGFKNYHALVLATNEQNEEELDAIFQSLHELTNAPFAQIKAGFDAELAKRYGIAPAEIRPWHYHDAFFQEAPLLQSVDLDRFYRNKDVRELGQTFYQSIGLPVESVLAVSDLYEREGKNPHAFSTDIDRLGDVRILCNLENNESWMETLLHELGHAVYDKYHDPAQPFLLRQPAHAFTTEAIANFFGRLSRNPAWMQPMLGLMDAERREIESVSATYARQQMLVFARWSMVMYYFEKGLYADPGQDLNALWWQLVEKYQLVKKPAGRNEPDWASKIHIAMYPCYYHNYLLGQLLASQLNGHIVKIVLAADPAQTVGYVGEKRLGDYLRRNLFEPGSAYPWNEMIRRATGEPLSAKYFVQEYVQP